MGIDHFSSEVDGPYSETLAITHLSARYVLGPGISVDGTIGTTAIESNDPMLTGDYGDFESSYAIMAVHVDF